jgi:hypothetical protein
MHCAQQNFGVFRLSNQPVHSFASFDLMYICTTRKLLVAVSSKYYFPIITLSADNGC